MRAGASVSLADFLFTVFFAKDFFCLDFLTDDFFFTVYSLLFSFSYIFNDLPVWSLFRSTQFQFQSSCTVFEPAGQVLSVAADCAKRRVVLATFSPVVPVQG